MPSAAEWLHSLGLDQYAQVFADNDIDLDLISSLSEQDLEKLGVSSMGHRKRLLKAIAELSSVTKLEPSPSSSPRHYTPAHLAERILSSKASLEGERKQVTVLFSDLKGSMELLAERDPEEARKILDPVLERMMEAVHRYEGTVNQVMGDGIMALFGAPLALEDHAVRGCYAALRMHESVKRHAADLLHTQGVTVRIRAGINSGEVVVRSISSDLHMDYTAVGQTTHLAARMEQLADPGSTLITAATLRLAEGLVQVNPRGPVPVKGLSEPVEIFELIGVGAVRSRLQAAAARGLSKFVGRSSELAQMFAALERALAGQGQVVALVGEPGVGKSRLVWEFTHSHRTHGWLILDSTSLSYGNASAYRPVIDLLKSYFQIEDRDDERRIREKATGKLLALDEALRPQLVPLLALIDVTVEDEKWNRLDPVQKRLRTLDACKRLMLREAQVQPLVLVFEDLHWIDSETQALLDSLVESLPVAKLMLLVTFRPEYQPRWSAKSSYTQLGIDPLSGASAEELLRTLLGGDASVRPLVRLLIERTQGNPLYLEESVRTLLETGALQGSRGAYRLTTELTSIQVPATVQAILAARIDRLAPEDKHLLQAAAVMGKDLPYALLQAITELPDESLRRRLAALQAAEFLYERSLFPELEYTFKHALTHEVAYSNVLQQRRKKLHAQIMASIERLYADRLTEQIERLAHHALRGEVWDKALVYLRQASEKALGRSANREAWTHLEQSILVLRHLPQSRANLEQEVDLRLATRTCLVPLGDLANTLDLARQAEPLAEAIGDPHREVIAHCSVTLALSLLGRSQEAVGHGERALAIAESRGEPILRIAARYVVGLSHWQLGAYREAIDAFERDVGLEPEAIHAQLLKPWGAGVFQEALIRVSHCAALSTAAFCSAELGAFDQATLQADLAVNFAQALDTLFLRAFADAWRGSVDLIKGDFLQALQRAERWLQVYVAADMRYAEVVMAALLGEAFSVSGRLEDAVGLLERAWQFAEPRALHAYGQPVLSSLGDVYGRVGRIQEAVVTGQRALELARKCGQRGYEARTLYVLGNIHGYGGTPNLNQSRLHYQQALVLAQELGMRPLEVQCRFALGELAGTAGERQTARELLAAAASGFHEMGMQTWPERAESALKRIDAR
jgi:class 3 adenylate cyclase/tetratricopeptide (TPR) repeat protein